ncbi:Oidioi.mRNA.OKI2018_I69.PAR.g12907.t1.cds [Oikopleura dioica]|uniref:Oidioi.mRNA.OKI2018_I69.PAR.g12907.t1.cds n=1 Tax=Oikopleura dioica TaxID=34765 RepID=A0ABN7S5N4_OIKDI|nr:Oidioi.mRNA.OKI2018_I69.PAR.g12907.t1.cds [Oikopleura dioica]
MTQGTNRDQFGDGYFTIWQHADGRLKLNGPLNGNTEFDEVEYYVDCDDDSWTNIAISQKPLEGGLLELSMYQDGELLGSNRVHSSDAFSGPIKVYASNPFMPPADFFQIRNFIHRSAPYEPASCDATDPCDGIHECETFINSCAVAPWRGTRLAEPNAHDQFKISAEVFCTDRVASNWENVLHVHTGTNREKFGDRYFTIWKQGGHADRIRIVAPAFDNPHYELNAYVDCAPGWHTFTVQQSKFDGNKMNLEIIFDGDVVESQVVEKNNLYSGPLFVDVSNEFAWPAAYDHLVRNFFHQNIACADPCVGKENCQTIVNECEILPVTNTKIMEVEASLNFKASVEVLCDHSLPLDGQWKNIFHMTGGENYGSPGDRTFAMFRSRNDNQLLITVNDPAGSNHQKYVYDECSQGRWNEYSVEVRQVENNPSLVRYVLSVNEREVLEGFYSRDGTLSEGPIHVYAADDYYQTATAHAIRNFYYQTFDELDGISCDDPTDPCEEEGLDNCNTIVDSCPVAPEPNKQIGTVDASLNYKLSVDVLCSHMMPLDGQWKNIFHVTGGENYGQPGDRTFAMFRNRNENKLLIVANDPNGSNHQSIRYVDCNDGEWNTYSLEVRQDETSINILKYAIFIDGVEIDAGLYSKDGALTEGDLKVFVSDDYYDSALTFPVRNFFYQTFDEIEEVACENSTDPCDGLENCTTVVDSCPINPKKNVEVGTISASLNYKFSADVLCSHTMPLDGQWKNIIHVTGGENYGNPGDRTFAMFRNRNENKLLIVANDPTGSNHQSIRYVDCNDGEWNTYSVEH